MLKPTHSMILLVACNIKGKKKKKPNPNRDIFLLGIEMFVAIPSLNSSGMC